ncbi:MAG: response regulator transcription factor [Xenococcaceae cyanobacterium]
MKKILVVDDDNILRTVLKHYLEKQGYQVEDVGSGREGLTAFNKHSPDLVVSDVAMPEMDGLEFCRQLRSHPSGQLVPFIFLSGKDDLEDKIQGHSMGADDYLTKPFEMRELLAKIESLLERSRRIHAEIVRLIQQIGDAGAANVLPSDQMSTPDAAVLSAANSAMEAEKPKPLPLTPAEERVFWEVIQGLTNKQISHKLFISPRTVQTHLSNILGKLQLENRSQLVRFAYEKGYEKIKHA